MNPRDDARKMPAPEFAHLGAEYVAYVKSVVLNGEVIYEIHAADGTELGQARDRDTAMAAVRQHGFEAASVH